MTPKQREAFQKDLTNMNKKEEHVNQDIQVLEAERRKDVVPSFIAPKLNEHLLKAKMWKATCERLMSETKGGNAAREAKTESVSNTES